MILVTTFLVNVLCALVPCPAQFPGPEISPSSQIISSDGIRRGRNVVNNSLDYDNEIIPEDFRTRLVPPRVEIENGIVEGYIMNTVGERSIYAFEGIPYGYAKRFKSPVPIPRPWKPQILHAKRVASECLQYNPFRGFRVTGFEDCLFVNIYSPQIKYRDNENKLPVLIWIHGGFYNFGTGGEYGPSYLLEKDVVLVTINYRLGPLGFLSTNDKYAPGNYGLKDQALAVKFVYDNIEMFGGDKERITLGGFSAGGSSTHFHMLSNQTKYFKKAFSMSGTAFSPWSLFPAEDVADATRKLAKALGCPTFPSKDLVDCMSVQNPHMIVARQTQLFPRWPYPYGLFGPVIESPEENPDAIILESPEDTYARGAVSKIPWIASQTKQEGHFALLFPYFMGRMPELHRRWSTIAPDFLVYANNAADVTDVTEKITKFYFKTEQPLNAPLDSFSQAYTDRHFSNALHKALQLHSQVADTYAYLFDFMGKYNMGNLIGLRKDEWGVGHGEDLFHVFNSSSSYSFFKKNDVEFKLCKVMINVISNFISKSEPFYTQENSTLARIWDRIEDKDKIKFLQLGAEIKMVDTPFLERVEFWNSLNLTSRIPNKYSIEKTTSYEDTTNAQVVEIITAKTVV